MVNPWLQAPSCTVNCSPSFLTELAGEDGGGWGMGAVEMWDVSICLGQGWRQRNMYCLRLIRRKDRNRNSISQIPRWTPVQGCKQPRLWKALAVEVRSWLGGGNICLTFCANIFEQLLASVLQWKLPSDNSFHFIFLYKGSETSLITSLCMCD